MSEEEERVYNAIKIGVVVLDNNFRVVDINNEVVEKAKLDRNKVIGTDFLSWFPKSKRERIRKELLKAWKDESTWGKVNIDVALGDKRKLHHFDLRFKRFKDRIIVTIIDRSWLYETLEKMNIIQSAVDHMAEGLVVTDIYGNIMYVNPGFTKITGYTQEEVIGKNPRILKSGKHDKKFYEKMWNTILSGKVWHGELINKRKDGSLYWEEMTIVPVKDEDGNIVNFVAVKHDITDRKKLEDELKKREKFYRSIFDSSLDGIFIETVDGKLIDVNEAGARMFGYTREELLEKGLKVIIPEEEMEKFPFIAKKVKKEGHIIAEVFNKHKDGYLIPVELSANLVQLDGKDLVIVIARDLRYREEQEAKYRILGEMLSDAVVMINDKGEIEYWNPAAERIFGYSEEEVHKKYFGDFLFPKKYKSFAKEILQRINNSNETYTKRFEAMATDKNGNSISIEIGISVFSINKRRYALSVIRDITERKKMEEELKRKISELESLYNFSLKISGYLQLNDLIRIVYKEAKKLLKFDSFAIGLVDKKRNKIKYDILTWLGENLGPIEIDIDPKNSLSGWVITSKKPLLIRDSEKEKDKLPAKWIIVKEQTRSWLGVPLIYKNEVLGIIIVQSYKPNMYSENDKNFLITLASQLSIAIMNALLYDEIKRTNEKLEGLINNPVVGISTVDLDGNITFTNTKFAEILGYDVNEILGKNIFDLTTEEGKKVFKESLKRRKKGHIDYYENVFVRKDGKIVDVLISASPLRDRNGKVIGSIGIILDITERKKWETELQKMNETLKTLYNISLSLGEKPSLKDLFELVYQELGKIFNFNWFFIGLYDKKRNIIKYDFMRAYGKDIQSYTIKYDPENSLSGWVIHNKKPLLIRNIEKEKLPAKYGLVKGEKEIQKSFVFVPLIYHNEAIGVLSIQHKEENVYDENALQYLTIIAKWLAVTIKNISLYNEIKKTRDWLESLLNNALVGIASADINENIIFANEKFAEMLGYSINEIIGMNLRDLTPPESFKSIKEGTLRRMKGISDFYEAQFMRKDGRIIDVLIYASPQYDENGNVIGSTGVVVDITERKAMERRIAEERERYKKLFEAMANIVVIVQDEKIVYVNKVFESATGYSSKEVIGKLFVKFVHPDMREVVLKNYRKRIQDLPAPEHYIIKILSKNGKSIWMDLRATPIDWENGKAVLASMVDITELKEMEDKLIALDETARRLKLARTKEEMYETTIESLFEILNLHSVAILEVRGNDVVMVKSRGYSNPDFKISIDSKKGVTAWVARNNLPYYSPDTSEDPLYIEGAKGARCEYATPISIENKLYGVLDVQKSEPYSLSEDDFKLIDLMANNLAVALKSLENQEELKKAKNLQELMLHIVSHDLKNPLAVLSGYVDLLRVDFKDEYLDAMERAIEEASNIIEKARLFSRLGAGKIEEEKILVNLRKEVEEAASIITHKYRDAKLTLNLGDIELYAYPIVKEVFINLMDNAFKYGASEVIVDGVNKDKYVEIRISDDGPGIPDNKKKIIFKPFETLSSKKGSGLGLTIVKMIIDLHEGKIWVEDNKPKGSIFVIQLPKD